MNRSRAIFQEIESKLVKDHYASKLPIYHPAKGRRKRGLRVTLDIQPNENHVGRSSSYQQAMTLANYNQDRPEKPYPDIGPEIERTEETDIPRPDEREIDPGRDFPQRDLPHPDEEELPDADPDPEIEPNRIEKDNE